ncbi:MAG: redoxin domain-containing protein [Pedobacter sp.]|uniref:redoxin family protein n=1 Tax=Pedobacter sp. TaxID=1411316 RepID=UPI003561440F
MKRFIKIAMLCGMAIPSLAIAQHKKTEVVASKSEISKLAKAVEAAPDSLSFHNAYLKAVDVNNASVVAQYDKWMKKFPKSAIVPYAIAEAYLNDESPKAKPYLLKAVAIDPKFAEAWDGLWIDAQRWGDFKSGDEYLKKAAESDPQNAAYAFYYSSSFEDKDPQMYHDLTMDVVKRFPESDRGAQALYWYATRSKAIADKLKYFELLRKSYSPAKFNWSSSGMTSYFDLLLMEDAKKALALAEDMAKIEKHEKEWANLKLQAQRVNDAGDLAKNNKLSEAMSQLDQVKVPRYFKFNKELIFLKAEMESSAGKTNTAYTSLITSFAKQPNTKLIWAIMGMGAKLGKDPHQVDADIMKYINDNAKPATPFSLKNYFTSSQTSLSDYKGKVVLLTYWFPGCGPCRGEFPHFENVVSKFKGQDFDYVGINIVSEQNDYVVPFMKGSGYSFTPLEDVKGRVKGNLDNRGAAPVNFLIDKQGRVVFSNFRTDGDNEDELELMIKMLLADKKL